MKPIKNNQKSIGNPCQPKDFKYLKKKFREPKVSRLRQIVVISNIKKSKG
jgi:hypothetical protein